ncbi:GNAT family N-acetyltransferase [Nocardioides zeae]|uniref:GNAT family N-acetyltransferase n=1 Tax=Nocardioides zeae TaxID=1457234 RepID=A0A6P0HD24_9ACTN|nr:GNAT family N-acetyltransferase [Nocardioides zeae]
MSITITIATTNDERAQVQALFSAVFVDIEPNAVPVVEHDYLYAPLIAQVRNGSGRLIAAAMTCRTQIAAGSVMAQRAGLPDRFNVLPVLDAHSELDLLAVDDDFRGQGLGSSLLRFLEDELAKRKVRTWFGNVTVNLEAARLRTFYQSHGFTVLPDFAPLPPLLGRNWTLPGAAAPQFYFYKRPKPSGSAAA